MKKLLLLILALACWVSHATYSPGDFHSQNSRLTNSWTTTATTVSNVTGLNFFINANEVWAYDFVLRAGSDSTAGVKFALNFPSGATCMATVNGTSNTISSSSSSIIAAAATLTTEVYVAFVSQAGIIYISGVITNAATAGTFQLQGAKVTSGTMTVAALSGLTARKLQ